MTQYQNPYAYPSNDPTMPGKTMSGLAVTALVMSIILCCPITTILGTVFGAIALIAIATNPMKKGKGLAWTAIIIGLLATLGWIAIAVWGYNAYSKPMRQGPLEAMQAGFAGNPQAFKDEMFGPASQASDAEVVAFIEQLRARYGDFRDCHLDEATFNASNPWDQMSKPIQTYPYTFQFANGIAKGTVELAFADPTGTREGLRAYFGRIVIKDEKSGQEYVFPPNSQPTSMSRGSRTSTTGSTSSTTAPARRDSASTAPDGGMEPDAGDR